MNDRLSVNTNANFERSFGGLEYLGSTVNIMSSIYTYDYPIMICGQISTGKSTLCHRFVFDATGQTEPTLGCAVLQKSVVCDVEGQTHAITVTILDTAGQERHGIHTMPPVLIRRAKLALLVYSVTDAESVDALQRWVDAVRSAAEVEVVVVANKTELAGHEEILLAGKKFAEENGFEHFEVSARTGAGANTLFDRVVEHAVEAAAAAAAETVSTNNEIIVENTHRKACCR